MTAGKRRVDANRRARFVQEYAKDLNATQAAIRAGYSRKTANRQGSRLLKNVDIAAQVRELLDRASQANEEITAERIKNELGRVAFSDIRKLFDADGKLRSIHELDPDTAACIASIEVDEITMGTGSDRVVIGHTKKIKLWNKNNALEQLAEIYGLRKTPPGTPGSGMHLTINLSRENDSD